MEISGLGLNSSRHTAILRCQRATNIVQLMIS